VFGPSLVSSSSFCLGFRMHAPSRWTSPRAASCSSTFQRCGSPTGSGDSEKQQLSSSTLSKYLQDKERKRGDQSQYRLAVSFNACSTWRSSERNGHSRFKSNPTGVRPSPSHKTFKRSR